MTFLYGDYEGRAIFFFLTGKDFTKLQFLYFDILASKWWEKDKTMVLLKPNDQGRKVACRFAVFIFISLW